MSRESNPQIVCFLLKTGGIDGNSRVQIRDRFGSLIAELGKNDPLPKSLAGVSDLKKIMGELDTGTLHTIRSKS